MRVLLILLTLLRAQGARVKVNDETGSKEGADAKAQTKTQALQTGKLVLDRFKLVSLVKMWPDDMQGFKKVSYLGRGAFGETWLAFDQKRNQNVAVKFFYRESTNKSAAAKFFHHAFGGGDILLNMQNANMNERAQLAAAGKECDVPAAIIANKNFPAGQLRFAKCLENNVKDSSHAHLVMEVAGTQNLEEYVLERPDLSSSIITRIAKMILEGLVQMEGAFVHKDIKPANFMVFEAEDGQLYLRYIDFGTVARENEASGVSGTYPFMPPDMWPFPGDNPRIDHKFDIYSAGETLYWVICGKTFHEYIFASVGWNASENPWAPERDIRDALQTKKPSSFCGEPRVPGAKSQNAELFKIVTNDMMALEPSSRVDGSVILKSSIFTNINTMPSSDLDLTQMKPVATARAPPAAGSAAQEAKKQAAFWRQNELL